MKFLSVTELSPGDSLIVLIMVAVMFTAVFFFSKLIKRIKRGLDRGKLTPTYPKPGDISYGDIHHLTILFSSAETELGLARQDVEYIEKGLNFDPIEKGLNFDPKLAGYLTLEQAKKKVEILEAKFDKAYDAVISSTARYDAQKVRDAKELNKKLYS